MDITHHHHSQDCVCTSGAKRHFLVVNKHTHIQRLSRLQGNVGERKDKVEAVIICTSVRCGILLASFWSRLTCEGWGQRTGGHHGRGMLKDVKQHDVTGERHLYKHHRLVFCSCCALLRISSSNTELSFIKTQIWSPVFPSLFKNHSKIRLCVQRCLVETVFYCHWNQSTAQHTLHTLLPYAAIRNE